MLLKQFVVGQLEVNCWIAGDKTTREVMVIDPGDAPDLILDWIKQEGLKVKYLVCTHSHFDHVGALPELKAFFTEAEIVLHKDDLPIYERAGDMGRLWGFNLEKLPDPDRLVEDGDEITIGDLCVKIIHTPGHSPGGICLLNDGTLFSGDTLFAGSIGRTDLPGGDYNALMNSLKKLADLPGNTIVHTGHGPSSTIGQEKKTNPFMTGEL